LPRKPEGKHVLAARINQRHAPQAQRHRGTQPNTAESASHRG
jgi:hypothetical protein